MPASKRPTRVGGDPSKKAKKARSNAEATVRAEAAPDAVVQELARVLDKDAVHMPNIRKTDETPPRISALDVAMAVTGKDNNQAARAIRDITAAHPEVKHFLFNFQFPGQGQRKTPVTDVRGIVEVVMLLPGKRAATARRQAAEILVRYMGGDVSLVGEIIRNRATQDALAQADPQHPARAFGQHVEAASSTAATTLVSQELVMNTCEAIIQTAMPLQATRETEAPTHIFYAHFW
jgi:hypothetical protein